MAFARTLFAEAEFVLKELNAMEYKKISVPYDKIVLADGSPNEAYLAELRDSLKSLESADEKVILEPSACDAACKDTECALALTAAYKHCARRVKDCAAVAGFAVPEAFSLMERGGELAENFRKELLEKHPHYIFV